MKTCPQCGQNYDDEINFCLTDGTTLDWSSAPTVASVEMPTVIRSAPAIIPVEQPSFQQPFQPQIPPAQPQPARSGAGFLWAVIAFLLFLIIAGGVGFTVYLMRPITDDRGKATSNSTPSGGSKDEISEEKERLKADQERLDEEREKLEKDKKALEEKKKQTPTPMPTVPPPTQYRTAYIIDPPTNVRATPNGRIICVIRQRNAPVSIIGPTGVTDSNGTWYYTDACGTRGVIHSSQFRY